MTDSCPRGGKDLILANKAICAGRQNLICDAFDGESVFWGPVKTESGNSQSGPESRPHNAGQGLAGACRRDQSEKGRITYLTR